MNFILLELILVATVALGIGFWQLYDVNKELKKDRIKEQEANKNNAASSADDQPASDG